MTKSSELSSVLLRQQTSKPYRSIGIYTCCIAVESLSPEAFVQPCRIVRLPRDKKHVWVGKGTGAFKGTRTFNVYAQVSHLVNPRNYLPSLCGDICTFYIICGSNITQGTVYIVQRSVQDMMGKRNSSTGWCKEVSHKDLSYLQRRRAFIIQSKQSLRICTRAAGLILAPTVCGKKSIP